MGEVGLQPPRVMHENYASSTGLIASGVYEQLAGNGRIG